MSLILRGLLWTLRAFSTKILDQLLTLAAIFAIGFAGLFAADALTEVDLLAEIWDVLLDIDDRVRELNAQADELIGIAEEGIDAIPEP